MNTKGGSLDQKSCKDCPIRYRAVCSYCEPAEFARLEQIKYYRSYQAGQPVVWAGDQLEFVASVVSGVATLTQALEDGRTQMVGLLLPSDFFGRPGNAVAHFDMTAVSDLTLCCFRRSQFEKLIEKVPHIGQRLLEMTLDDLDAARDWMLILGRKSAREKIASFLTVFVRRTEQIKQGATRDGTSFDMPITREAMANYLGLTIETVSRQISALKYDNVIQLEGKRRIIIPDFAALIDEAGNDEDGELVV